MRPEFMKVTRSAVFLVLLLLQSGKGFKVLGRKISVIRREDFPSDFIFGAGTSAYEYEGATTEDGKAPSIWDSVAYEGNDTTEDLASDGYHKYKEDIEQMSVTGLEGYRFSISWSRLLPSGRGTVNPKGLEYYNNVINELIKYGIQPFVTIHQFDLPQVLQNEYGGWLSPKIINDFKEFANVCFREFGDRVQHWITINEPNANAIYSFDYGIAPPNRCSYPFGHNCRGGNSTTEPYIAAHNMLLAHSTAFELYRTKYQATQKGKIGINVYGCWSYPLTKSIEDALAAKRAVNFYVGWFINPIVFGDYPEDMKENAGSRLPSFTESEVQLVKGSFDFIGINYYFSFFSAYNVDNFNGSLRDVSGDMLAKFTAYKDKPLTDKLFLPIPLPKDPQGLVKLLKFLKDTYGNPPIYILENGYAPEGKDKLNDTERISYLSGYIGSTLEALRDGSSVRGYFVWSFVDQLVCGAGRTMRMGLYHVNFKEACERTPKQSAYWYSNFIKHGGAIQLKERFSLPARYSSF